MCSTRRIRLDMRRVRGVLRSDRSRTNRRLERLLSCSLVHGGKTLERDNSFRLFAFLPVRVWEFSEADGPGAKRVLTGRG